MLETNEHKLIYTNQKIVDDCNCTAKLKFIFEHVELDGNLDLKTLVQTEENYKDATGEDLSDFLDLDTVM